MSKIFATAMCVALLASMLTITALSDGDSFLTSERIENAPAEDYVYTSHYSTEWEDNFSVDLPLTEKHIYEGAVITHYCPCVKCCGKWSSEIWGGQSKTASGTYAVAGRTVGCDPNLIPYGTHVWIDGHEYVVEDTGSGLTKGKLHIDIFCDTHQEALNRGMYHTTVAWETNGGY